ncbi:MAG: hypothetical protein R3F43_27980 [bacterium]
MLITALLGLTGPAVADAPPYTVVTSADSPLAALKPEEIERIYLGRVQTVHDVKVLPALGDVESPAVARFLDDVLAMDGRRFESYWRKRLFSSRGVPPKVEPSAPELLRWVRKTPGAVAVIPAAEGVPEGLKALTWAPPPTAAPPTEPAAPPTAAPPTAEPPPPVPPRRPRHPQRRPPPRSAGHRPRGAGHRPRGAGHRPRGAGHRPRSAPG